MRYWFDTEFAENGTTIKLISIGMVSEDGREYYAVAADGWGHADCDSWVLENVVSKIEKHGDIWKTRSTIRSELLDFIRPMSSPDKPEFWAYFGDYDWVVFCQLWGRMVDLPDGLPFYCRDLKQLMDDCGVVRGDLPPLAEEDAHNALVDARWTRDAWVETMKIARIHGRR